jgi:hypothetical protein
MGREELIERPEDASRARRGEALPHLIQGEVLIVR